MTTDDYYTATAANRDRMVREARAAIKPPAAHTRRGKPRSPELDGHHEATKTKRTPTHRRNIPAVMPARIHSILHLIGGSREAQ